MKTIVAIFDDISVARQVVEDLVKADFARHSISLVTNDAQNQYSHFLEEDYVPRDEAVTALEGAGFGAAVGALAGILVGLVALIIPSISLGFVGGPIIAGLLGAVAGALMGGFVGAIIKITVPEDESPYYAEAIKRGATLISIETDTPRQAEEIMHHYGTINLHERIGQWRQAGWKGFNAEPETKEEDTARWEITSVTSKETTSTKFSPMRPIGVADAKPVLPVEAKLEEEQSAAVSLVEPKVELEYTEKTLTVTAPAIAEISTEPLPLLVREEAERAYGKGLDEGPLAKL
jgi:hypothetical protein